MTFDPIAPWPVIAIAAVAALAAVVVRQRRGAGIAGLVRSVLAIALVAAVALDPAAGRASHPQLVSSADVLFVVDTTGSIAAEDYDSGRPRLEGVRADIDDIASRFAGARFALITFDADAALELPWTTDAAALQAAVDVLRQEQSYTSSGSELGVPIDTIGDALDRSAKASEGRARIVVLMSDGEQTAGGSVASFASLGGSIDGGAVFGYGTEQGGPMLEYWGYYSDGIDPGYIYDYETSTDAVSRIDEDNLRGIADDLGVDYLHRTAPGGLDSWAATVADTSVERDGEDRDGARRLYWIPALALVALALWQLAATASAIADDRRTFPAGVTR